MTPIRIAPAALHDIKRIQTSYDELRCGAGDAFREQIDRALNRIQAFPGIAQAIRPNVRRFVLPQFPFFIVYRIGPSVVDVVGVMPTAADPARLLQRIGSAG